MQSQLNAYKKNQINTSSSEKLVLMLYDGAKKHIVQAIKATEAGDIQSAHHDFLRAQDIVSGLMAGLNYEAGPIAQQYYALYEYIHYRLIQANLKKDSQEAQEALAMIEELRSAWAQIIAGSYASAANVDPKRIAK